MNAPIEAAAPRGKRKGAGTKPAPAAPDEDPPDGGAPAPPGERPRDPGPSPVRPIGHRMMRFYFFNRSGELVELAAQALGQKSVLRALFGGADAEAYLRNRWPHFDKDGNWTQGFNTSACSGWLTDSCIDLGIFDPDRLPLRGHGVWRAQGAIAIHVGGKVIFLAEDGQPLETRPAGFATRGALWPAQDDVPPPAPACDAATAQQVERMFARWNWWNLGEERIFTGLWAAGLLGAAIGWRSHGILVGPAGTGKSTLLELYCDLSPLALFLNGYTEAGVRQLLSGRAAPLVLDEADEDAESMGRLQRVISLLRLASGGAGGKVVKGSGEGRPTLHTFTSPTVLGSIFAPPLMSQDASRITKMELIPIPAGAPPLPIEAMKSWSQKQAPGLWGRAITGLQRFRNNLATVRAVLLAPPYKCAPRLADQLGTILAARAMILEDDPLDARAAEDDILAVRWLLRSPAQAAEEGASTLCLQHLMTSQPDVWENGQKPTIESLVSRAVGAADEDARRKLVNIGLKLARFPFSGNGPECLLVARSHAALAKIFTATPWAGGRWCDALKYLPGASSPADPVSFCKGFKPRAVVIPLDCLPGDDDGAPKPAPVDVDDIPL